MTFNTKISEDTKESVDKKASTDQSSSPIPTISVPKGGGAIRGIGEKFAANPVTGTGTLSVPIFVTPARSGFWPQLSLSYDSGSGNGPFGFGWSLSLPSITRKTDKGLPRYLDADESDVFVLSGVEDLVPVFKKDSEGDLVFDEEPRDGYVVRRYRPRIEGLFARIERWIRKIDGDTHWRSISKDNIITVYGRNEGSRIVDPAAKSRVFSWLICESYDDKGNTILYEYKAEDEKNNKGIDLTQANERNRLRTANRYLKRILYGNRQPLLLDTTKDGFRKQHTEQIDFTSADWMFELVFDYGEGHNRTMPFDATKSESDQHQFVQASASASGIWSSRPDPFSIYRSGFEVRAYRRCQRVLMFHRFSELASEQVDGHPEPLAMPYLVRSTEFDYSDLDYSPPIDVEKELEHKGSTRFASFIRAVTQSGYVRDESQPVLKQNGAKYLTYIKKSLPPLEFDYTRAIIQEDIKDIDAKSLENLPYGLDDIIYQWVDLDGEGVSGILTEQAEAWFYKANLGSGRFGPMVRLMAKPSLAAISSGRQQLLDLAGDGQLDLVVMEGPVKGFYERTNDQGWNNFTSFSSIPNVSWRDPNLKFIDLTGDGHADIMITEDNVFTWYPSLAEEGFGPAEKVRQALDEEKGPRLVFDDGTQSVYLADMSGDGLNDLVRITNGGVCYWPNLGYGHFGAKVTMDNSPWFDSCDQFNQKHIRLADIDGSGTNDIIYLGRDGVRLYFNQSGNRWSKPRQLVQFPPVDSLSSVMTADLLGNGTACLIWSSALPGVARRPMCYIDLMGGQKPHLLIKSVNNLGAETIISYAPSTKFYLDDKSKGKPWITKIPFPVHVVERVETYDRISRSRFVTRYSYHHGYFDGVEREFRGFGMVEQRDTEEIGDVDPAAMKREDTNWDAASHVPPVHTKTWFHTGAYFEGEAISRHLEEEYYSEGDPSMGETGLGKEQLRAMLRDNTVLPKDISVEEKLEACRSLKGAILRQEIYALDRRPDGTSAEESDRPYSISERNYTIKLLQPRGINKHAVFFTHACEVIDFHYERKLFKVVGDSLADPIAPPSNAKNAADPRVTHSLTLAVDDYGNVLRSVDIGYGRRFKDPSLSMLDRDKQAKLLITLTENRYTNAVLENDAYRAPLPCEARTYEVLKVEPISGPSGVTALFRFDKLQEEIEDDEFSHGKRDILYEDVKHIQATENHSYRRLIEHVRIQYRSNKLDRLLPLCISDSLESLALPGETYKLAFTPGLLAEVYQRERVGQAAENLLPDPSAVLGSKGTDGGGYVDIDGDGHWWIPSGRIFYSPDSNDDPHEELDYASKHFFLPHRYRDPFHTDAVSTETFVSYDDNNLLVQETRDVLGNRITIGERKPNGDLDRNKPGHDYRVLQPRLVMDPNRNRTEVAFDALGMVVGTAVMGKPEDNPQHGDVLDAAFRTDLTLAEIEAFYANPKGPMSASLLDKATARIIYDLTGYWREQDAKKKPPAFAATLARETHASDPVPAGGLKIQISFSYSDGFGREIQKKIQAEAGPVPKRNPATGLITVDAGGQPEMTEIDVRSRWVGSGWTVFNNKGKPVRQFEPFFTDIHRFEFDVRIGVSPVLFYDPVGRVVATLHPNHSWEKVVFDPWHQKTYDVNDTIKIDPRTDVDISGYVLEYFKQVAPDLKSWKTWLGERGVDPESPPQDSPGLQPEKKAAVRTVVHADTPAVAYFDTLGRTFLTIANNKFKRRDSSPADPPTVEIYQTRVLFDIEGNPREITDANLNPALKIGRIVMIYEYDMLGNRIHQESMEAGERWMLNDVTGKSIRAWDSRDHKFRSAYDPLRRPTQSYLSEGGGQELLVGRTVYGEASPDLEKNNLRGKVFQVFDQAGVVASDEYDFKGNLLRSRRQLARDYKKSISWSAVEPLLSASPLDLLAIEAALASLVEGETYRSSTEFDALNRPIELILPHSDQADAKVNVIHPIYNEANLLDRVDANLNAAAAATHFVTNIAYNAKGQRKLIEYGNGVRTTYDYDPLTFRLTHLETLRGEEHLQDLFYTYDPAGNIIVIHDDAQQTIYFNGQVVKPDAEYMYDAIYRLIEASGREHIGQASQPHSTWNDEFNVKLAHPNDGQAMRNYFEFYEYDEVGNFLRFDHKARDGNWTRNYEYNEKSQIKSESFRKSNRLSRTVVHPNGQQPILEPYVYDMHGNMIRMPHLANKANPVDPNMHWDYKDQLQKVDMAGGGTAYYVYDASGQRMRKVVEKTAGLTEERIYLGNFEVFRKRNGAGAVTLERETLHIMDDKQRIALVETRTKGDDPAPGELIRYQFGNHLGSASLELDAKAQVISYEEYTPYGSTSYQAVRSQTETPKRYRYTGKERDEESGLYYHGARYYAPWLGRWASCDPGGIRYGLNVYVYVNGRPLILLDPMGTNGEGYVGSKPSADYRLKLDPKIEAQIRSLQLAGKMPPVPAAPAKPAQTLSVDKPLMVNPSPVLPATAIKRLPSTSDMPSVDKRIPLPRYQDFPRSSDPTPDKEDQSQKQKDLAQMQEDPVQKDPSLALKPKPEAEATGDPKNYRAGDPKTTTGKASASDILDHKPVSEHTDKLQDAAGDHAEKAWNRSSTGEKVLAIGGAAVVVGGGVAGVATNKEGTNEALEAKPKVVIKITKNVKVGIQIFGNPLPSQPVDTPSGPRNPNPMPRQWGPSTPPAAVETPKIGENPPIIYEPPGMTGQGRGFFFTGEIKF